MDDPFKFDRMLIQKILLNKKEFKFEYTINEKIRVKKMENIGVERLCRKCEKVCKKKCGGCKFVNYCSIKCQKDDWQRHKNECSHKM